MARYSDEQQAGFLLQLETLGFPANQDALDRVAGQRGAPTTRTLRRWWKRREVGDLPHVDRLVTKNGGSMVETIDHLLAMITREMESAIPDAPLNQLATTYGILFDKRRLLTGESTSNEAQQIEIRYANPDD